MSSLRTHIRTVDGIDLAARVWPVARPRCAVVLVHGFSAGKDHPDVVGVAERLRGAGFHVVAHDGRGHGDSGGLCSLGDLERHDVEAAVAAVRDASDRVVTLGASMGGIAVMRHAAEYSNVDGVVTVSAPARWELPASPKSMLAAVMTRTRAGRMVARRSLGVRIDPVWADPACPEDVAARISVPMAVVHGEADRIVRPDNARSLSAVGTGPRRLELIPGMGHAFHPLGTAPILESVAWAIGERRAASA